MLRVKYVFVPIISYEIDFVPNPNIRYFGYL